MASLVWLVVHRQGAASVGEIQAMVPIESARLDNVLERLASEGRVRRLPDAKGARYVATDCVIAAGNAAGWEAAVFDHYQAMVTALCAKLRRGVQKRRLGAGKPRKRRNLQPESRHIPVEIAREVWERDGGQCTFEDAEAGAAASAAF